MSDETNKDSFITNMLATIKEIQEELNELKIIKRGIVKKSTKRETVRGTVKRKTAGGTVKRKTAGGTVKRKTVRGRTKRKTNKQRQIANKPSYLTNLCPNQYENS